MCAIVATRVQGVPNARGPQGSVTSSYAYFEQVVIPFNPFGNGCNNCQAK